MRETFVHRGEKILTHLIWFRPSANSVFTDLGSHRPPQGQEWDLRRLARGTEKSRSLSNQQTEALLDRIIQGWASFSDEQGAWFKNTTVRIVGTLHGQNVTIPAGPDDGPEHLEKIWSWVNVSALESFEFAIATDVR